MHGPVKERLEEYLGAAGPPGDRPEVDSHLRGCDTCRTELEAMADQARLMRRLRAEEDLEAASGFCARVMSAVEARQKAPVLHAFADPVFGRRLVYACLATVLVLGSYLVYTEQAAPFGNPDPVGFFAANAAGDQHVGMDQQRDREVVLVSLASYRE
jgi:predicted anti-sigma-YlaC factor YlaD